MTEEAYISVKEDNDTVTVFGGGFLTYQNSSEFGKALKSAALTAENVIADLREATFIDTQIVEDLGRAGAALLKRNKRLRIIADSKKYPIEVLRISRYDQFMDIDVT